MKRPPFYLVQSGTPSDWTTLWFRSNLGCGDLIVARLLPHHDTIYVFAGEVTTASLLVASELTILDLEQLCCEALESTYNKYRSPIEPERYAEDFLLDYPSLRTCLCKLRLRILQEVTA